MSKLPFSNDVTSESRVLINRNIRDIVNGVAPFLTYDNDPYIVVSNEGRLFWMIDAFHRVVVLSLLDASRRRRQLAQLHSQQRQSRDRRLQRHAPRFYVFDNQDPMIAAYRRVFPNLFQDASQMPADLRAHVRYPETLMRAQGEVYGLYHTQNPKVFFQREDVWNIAQQVTLDDERQETERRRSILTTC